jgi:ribonuclease HI
MRKVTIYTDGAFKSNTKRGGTGYLIIDNLSGKRLLGSTGYFNTSSDRMELMAAKEALSNLKAPCRVELFTDSRYLCDSINKGWLNLWLGDPHFMNRKNEDIWRNLHSLTKFHYVLFTWVKSHSIFEGNRIADNLATKACKETSPIVDSGFVKLQQKNIQQSILFE